MLKLADKFFEKIAVLANPRKARRRKGMSTVEMLTIIALMAILGGTAVAVVGKNIPKAKYTRANSELANIQNAFVRAASVQGDFNGVPTGDNNLTGSLSLGSLGPVVQSFLDKPFDDLKDPWGNPYKLRSTYSSDGRGVIIVYAAPDGDGTNFTAGSVTVSAKKNPFDGDAPMAKVIYNVSY
ncbi:type II secretion system protein [Thermovirga lienii]|uniref:type II secretion system protein n=1 Tax=Thermovirga lienii TaxID=336261 RepID=UPI002FDFA9E2